MSDSESTQEVLYLDYCETGVTPIPGAVRRIQEHAHDLNRYPRGLYEEALRSVSKSYGVDEGEMLLTSGVDEAVDLVLLETKALTYVTPGFWGYWERADALDIPAYVVPLTRDWELPEAWQTLSPGNGAFIVAQPNNPTGFCFSDPTWLATATQQYQIVMIDETYRLTADQPAPSSLHHETGNLLTFISFSKAYGLAGVRIGALIGSSDLLTRLARRRRFHSVNSLGLHAAIGAAEDPSAIDLAVGELKRLRPQYAQVLANHSGLFDEVRSTDCTFVLGRVRDDIGVPTLLRALSERGVIITDCSIFGLPDWVRVGVADADALERLAGVLQESELGLQQVVRLET